jgi:hypothetical protein
MEHRPQMTLDQIQTFVDRFSQQAVVAHGGYEGGHAYVAGYLGSMVTRLIRNLPIEEQLVEITGLMNSTVWNKK